MLTREERKALLPKLTIYYRQSRVPIVVRPIIAGLLDTCDALQRRAEIAERALEVDIGDWAWMSMRGRWVDYDPPNERILWWDEQRDDMNLAYAIAEYEWEEEHR